jgi:hypothetical protein
MRRTACTTTTLLALVMAWAACGQLDAIDPDRCGNGVLERGEDCDTFESLAGGELCLSAGQPGQCRYSCAAKDGAASSDPTNGRYSCPDGWGCGADGLCRRHSGELGDQLSTAQAVGRWFDVGDFDGDDRLDVISVSDSVVSVDYLEEGVYRQSHRFPFEAEGLPSVADANRDGIADLLTPSLRGLALLRGSPTRTLIATTFPSLAIPIAQQLLFVSIDMVPELADLIPGGEFERYPGDEPIVVTDNRARAVINSVLYAADVTDVSPVVLQVEEVEGKAFAAVFDETVDVHGAYTETPEQLVFPTADGVTLYRLSVRAADVPTFGLTPVFFMDATTETNAELTPPASHPSRTQVTLPAEHRLNEAMATQANGEGLAPGESRWRCGAGYALADEHLDLVIDAFDLSDLSAPDVPSVPLVAFGLGDGNFHSNPCELADVIANLIPADNAFARPDWWQGCATPSLGIGDVDGDGAPDIVTADRTYLSGLIPAGAEDQVRLCSSQTQVFHPDVTIFTEVGIADFDGDGIGDVVATNTEASVDFLTSTASQPALRHVKRVLTAPAEALRLGDYDGDGLMDAAFAENRGSEFAIDVLFGELGAIPGEPRTVAVVDELISIEEASFPRAVIVDAPTAENDAPEDLLIAVREPNADFGVRVAILDGRADRQLQAPFIYSQQTGGDSAAYIPYGAAIGPFDVSCNEDEAADGNELVVFVTGGLSEPLAREYPATNLGSACVDDDARFTVAETSFSDLGLASSDLARATAVIPVSYRAADDPTVTVTEPLVTTFNFVEGARQIELFFPKKDTSGGDLAWLREGSVTIPDATVAGADATDVPDPTSPIRKWSPFINNVAASCALWPGGDAGLAFLAVHDDGTCPEGSGAVSTPASMVLHVFPPETLQAIQFSSLAGALEIRHGANEAILGYACLNLDEDVEQELVMLKVLGEIDHCVESFESPPPFTAELRVAEVVNGELVVRDEPLGTLSESQLFLDNSALPPASGLAAADFNRDGVDDLFVATPTNGIVWFGKPVAP